MVSPTSQLGFGSSLSLSLSSLLVDCPHVPRTRGTFPQRLIILKEKEKKFAESITALLSALHFA